MKREDQEARASATRWGISVGSAGQTRLIEHPIFVIGCSRSGTTLLFRTLCAHPLLWTRYEENQHVFHRFFPIDAELGEAVPDPAPPEIATALVDQLYGEAHNKEYFKDRGVLKLIPRKALQTPVNPLYKRPPLRLLEKTPANCFRIPLLSGAFPDARFVLLLRRPEDTISSLMEGWRRQLARVIFDRDSNIEDRALRESRWHYLVPPGWARWVDEPLERICAFQWVSSVSQAEVAPCRVGHSTTNASIGGSVRYRRLADRRAPAAAEDPTEPRVALLAIPG